MKRPGKPHGGIDRMSHAELTTALRHQLAVPIHRHGAVGQVHIQEWLWRSTDDVHGSSTVICNGIGDADIPILKAAVDNLQ
ncbi:hypothetical protein D3C81_2004800 [compost metagenome]